MKRLLELDRHQELLRGQFTERDGADVSHVCVLTGTVPALWN